MASNLGLVSFKSADQVHAEQLATREADDQMRRQASVESSLSALIRKNFESAKQAKQRIERRLVDCAERQKGQYSASKLAAIRAEDGSEVYPKITTTKCRAAAAWIRDVLMPANGKAPFGLDPTPISDIPPEVLQAFIQRFAEQQNEQIDEERATAIIIEKVQELAEKAAEKHEQLIRDQLTEGQWYEEFERFIDDFTTFPTAFMCGPTLSSEPTLQWAEGWNLIETEEVRMVFRRVSPYDAYPSADMSDIQRGGYFIERRPFGRSTLNRLKGIPGYSEEAINAVLTEHGQGGLREWLAVDSQRAELEDRQHDHLIGSSDTIEGLHYWGSAQGLMLLQWGMNPDDVPDPLGEYQIDAILIGRHVVRAVINRNPLGKRPYRNASFQNVSGSIWGLAIPELMDDIQDMCCAVARAQANNTAFASGPQVEVNTSRLAPDENPNEMYPLKRWRTKSDYNQAGAEAPAIRFYQPNSLAGELMSVYDNWEKRADDATNIPRYAYGNEQVGGAGQTMGGLAMLMESANKGIKDAIRHIDRGIIAPSIEAMWLHNMRYSSDNSIKGDCKITPRGASAMLMKEQVQQGRAQFLGLTGNELDMSIIGRAGRAKLLRTIADDLDIVGLVPSEEELEAQDTEQAEQQAANQEKVMQLEAAKLENDTMKAQATMTGAQVKAAEADVESRKTDAETQRILVEIRKLLMELGGAPGITDQQPGANA